MEKGNWTCSKARPLLCRPDLKKYLPAAGLIFFVTLSFLLTNCYRTQKQIGNFQTFTEQGEKAVSPQGAGALSGDSQAGAFEERVRYENSGPRNNIIEIKEKMFIAQTNDIYLNTEDYLGKIIKLEGLFKQEQSTLRDDPYCFVIRYGPGCCGYDGNAGFEVAWSDGYTLKPPYPKVDDWVEAAGELKYYEEDGYPYLYLALSSLKVLDTRGAEFVSQ
jgi:uncharacterized membrane protein YcgQ (UPF0703/DUF1980 family)